MSTKRITIPAPSVAYLGKGETNQARFREIADRLSGGYDIGGRNTKEGVADLLRSVADAMDAAAPTSTSEPDSYYIAGRDVDGLIRMNGGKGALLALSTHNRENFETWIASATDPHYIRSYQAGLDFLDAESAARAATPDA